MLKCPQNRYTQTIEKRVLSVGFLVASTSAWAAELLGLALSRIRDEQASVVLDQNVLNLLLARLIDELLVVGDETLRDGLSDGVDLSDMTTTSNSHSDVNHVEPTRRGTVS